jgi:esterase/lipase/1-acyl-sn-glycerol-3-phosphate acyltransferase
MNRSAYLTTGLVIKAVSGLSRARVRLYGEDRLPRGGMIFVVNHFTRIETLLLPYHVYQLIQKPVWSLAAPDLFKGALAAFLQANGAVSTAHPDRDRLIVRSLLSGEAAWIIFPEGRMVKNKKIFTPDRPRGRFELVDETGRRRPHTGAATLALRTEFYRQRMAVMARELPEEARRLADLYALPDPGAVLRQSTWIVPVNVTYYPLRSRQNALSQMARLLVDDIPERLVEEIMTEGAMLLSGVDMDIRFGAPICAAVYLKSRAVREDISARRPIDFDEPIASRPMLAKTAHRIMERYMAAIYRLTTINPDHLFAAILGLCPQPAIPSGELRRRVFLAATLDFEKLGLHRHRRLTENQVHLLTDDRFRTAADFIEMAEASGVVRRQEDGLLVKTGQEKEQPPFHRARIDAPVAVIFNEIEPLEELLGALGGVARMPAARLRHEIGRRLERAAEFGYLQDWQRFAHIADRSPEGVGRPILKRSSRRRVGILVIHGYMAAPLEVAGLVEDLAARGYWVYAPRLQGHGTAPEDLARRRFADWVTSVDEGYALLANSCTAVVAGGFSTGAGLALDLASRAVPLAGVFAVCPPFSLQEFASRLAPAVDIWNKLLDRVHLGAAKKVFVENRPENPQINYHRNPIRGVRELSRLMDGLEDRLAAVRIPSLVVQSLGDPVVDYKGTWRLFNRLGAADREFVLLHFQRHGILLGPGAERVYRTIADFVARVAPMD